MFFSTATRPGLPGSATPYGIKQRATVSGQACSSTTAPQRAAANPAGLRTRGLQPLRGVSERRALLGAAPAL